MNRYDLKEKIGEGAFGEVFLATKKNDPLMTKVSSPTRKRMIIILEIYLYALHLFTILTSSLFIKLMLASMLSND
jgi:serine/threonine protein kinase